MNFSENWLREWINPSITTKQLCAQLTSSGLEVEQFNCILNNVSNIFIGEIIKKFFVNKKYCLYIVNIGNSNFLKIISNNDNYRKGSKVLVANKQSIFFGNKKPEDFYFKGIKTDGIFCSYFHLGLFPYNDQIIELPFDTLIGCNIENINFLNDVLIKVNVNANRLDEYNILGIAREVAAINRLPLPTLRVIKKFSITSKKIVNVYSQLPLFDFIYLGRVIENININVSTPFWIKDKLLKSHVNSKNIIQDIINFVLIDIGEPLHILDLDSIESNTMYLKQCSLDEKVILYNGKKISLKKNTIIISDASNKVLILGNNFTSEHSMIKKSTKSIFLGSLCFNFIKVKDDIKRNNLNEKIIDYYHYSIDMHLQKYAIEYATKLILKFCGGELGELKTLKKIKSKSFFCKIMKLRFKHINYILGAIVNRFIVKDILLRLGYKIIELSMEAIEVAIPQWRTDILIEEDIINDFLRLYGYSKIRETPFFNVSDVLHNENYIYFTLKKVKSMLVNRGYYETINYSFVNPKIQKLIEPNKKSLSLKNPISSDMSEMRLSLWTGLLNNVLYNQNRQQDRLRFFESGLCFFSDVNADINVKQELFLAGVISGNIYQSSWNLSKRKVDFYDLKGDLESVIELYTDLNYIEFRHKLFASLLPGKSAAIYMLGKYIGKIGVLHPKIKKTLNLKNEVIIFELLLEKFKKKQLKIINKISDFPSSRRDISIIISNKITFYEVINECKKLFTNKIFEINIFDVYSNLKSHPGKKSLTISFVFQDIKKTLNDKEIDFFIQKCIKMLKNCFQAILRC